MRGVRGLGVVAVAALTIGAAACSSAAPSGSANTTTSTTTATTSSTSTSSTTTSSVPPTTTTTSSAPEDLFASAADKESLTQAFLAYKQLAAQQIAGTKPGSVFYGYYPPTSTYWAVATFSPTPSASQQTKVALQDNGGIGIFSHTAQGAWTMISNGPGVPPCWTHTALPPALLSLWGITDSPACSATTATT